MAKLRPALLWPALLAGFLGGCRQDPVQVSGGTSSETVIGQVFLPGGGPAANVSYHIRDIRFLANPSSISKVSAASRTDGHERNGLTGPDGGYRIDSLAPGRYLVEFRTGTGLGLALPLDIPRAMPAGNPGKDTLRVTGTLRGTLAPANGAVQELIWGHAHVQLFGMERVVAVDPASGRFHIDDLPPGRFELRASSLFPSLQTADLAGVEVRSGDSTELGSIPLNRILTSAFTSLVPDGLIAYWPCDEGSGSETSDPVGGFDGNLEGGTAWTQGVREGSLTLDGNDGFISIPTIYLDSDFTIAAWVRLRGLIDNNQLLAGMDDSTNLNFAQKRFRLYIGGFRPELVGQSGEPPWDAAISQTPIVPEKWTHVAVTRQSGALILYMDGAVVGGGNWKGTFLMNRLGRGMRIVGAQRTIGYMNGDLDEFRVYARALTPEEVASLASLAAKP